MLEEDAEGVFESSMDCKEKQTGEILSEAIEAKVSAIEEGVVILEVGREINDGEKN